jgi:hypothetical protein
LPAKLLKTWVSAGLVKLGHNCCDGINNPVDVRESAGRDNAWLGKRGQTVSRAQIRLRTVRIAAAKCGSLRAPLNKLATVLGSVFCMAINSIRFALRLL